MRLSGLDMLLRAGAGVFSKRRYAPVLEVAFAILLVFGRQGCIAILLCTKLELSWQGMVHGVSRGVNCLRTRFARRLTAADFGACRRFPRNGAAKHRIGA